MNNELKFWKRIEEELLKYGEVKIWCDDYMVLPNHDNICGLKLYMDKEQKLSIISHKHSYGGDNEFEVMPGFDEDYRNDVQGYLSEDEVIEGIKNMFK